MICIFDPGCISCSCLHMLTYVLTFSQFFLSQADGSFICAFTALSRKSAKRRHNNLICRSAITYSAHSSFGGSQGIVCSHVLAPVVSPARSRCSDRSGQQDRVCMHSYTKHIDTNAFTHLTYLAPEFWDYRRWHVYKACTSRRKVLHVTHYKAV
jgi:hypothetical protein